MAVLDQLTFANAAPKRDTSPIGRARRRMIEAIDTQLAIVEADATGTELRRTRQRWIKNDAGGKDLREVPLRLRRWWWKDDAGRVYLGLRHAGRPLALAPGMAAIEVGTMSELPGKLTILRDAVCAGELDGCMAEAPTRGFKKAQAKAVPTPAPAASKKNSRKPDEGARPNA